MPHNTTPPRYCDACSESGPLFEYEGPPDPETGYHEKIWLCHECLKQAIMPYCDCDPQEEYDTAERALLYCGIGLDDVI